MKKLKLYDGQPIKESISFKIDGIQAMLDEHGNVVSRSNKPIYNVDPSLLKPGKKYEIFLGTFKETDSVLSTHNHQRKVTKLEIYEIWPGTDPRLYVNKNTLWSVAYAKARMLGYEGIVIDHKYKVKPEETHDVPILEIIPGKGKHLGRMGALMTPMGKVGSGFTDKQREEVWNIGEYIEVKCMELTPDKQFRHPRFLRRRWDKNGNSEG